MYICWKSFYCTANAHFLEILKKIEFDIAYLDPLQYNMTLFLNVKLFTVYSEVGCINTMSLKYKYSEYLYLINQSTRTPFVIHYNDMRLSNYDHLKFEHLTQYQVWYDTFDRSWDRWLMHLPNHLEKYVTWPWLT